MSALVQGGNALRWRQGQSEPQDGHTRCSLCWPEATLHRRPQRRSWQREAGHPPRAASRPPPAGMTPPAQCSAASPPALLGAPPLLSAPTPGLRALRWCTNPPGARPLSAPPGPRCPAGPGCRPLSRLACCPRRPAPDLHAQPARPRGGRQWGWVSQLGGLKRSQAAAL